MVVAAPGVVPALEGRMRRLPLWSGQTLDGRQRKAVDSATILTVGEQGVMLTEEAGHNVTVPYDSVAALIRWNDGKRTLVGTDGFAIQLDPTQWPDGDALVLTVGARVSPDAIIPVDAPGPDRPRPAPAGASSQGSSGTGTPGSGPAPRAADRSLLSWRARVVRALSVTVAIFGVLAIAGGDVSGGIAFVAIGVAFIAWNEYQRHRRARRRG
jgi:hypothetical protein